MRPSTEATREPASGHAALRRAVATVLAVASLCGLVACARDNVPRDSRGRIVATVSKVVDGDTVQVRIGSRRDTVRLIGVDTPETNHPTKPVGCFGPEASAHTARLLPPGTSIALVRDEEARDRYGRLLAYVYRAEDDLFVNLELLAGGWGVPLPIEPNTNHASDFAAAATSAEASSLGLWGHCRG